MTSKKIPMPEENNIEMDMDLDINAFKEELRNLKLLIQEDMEADPEFSGECDMMVDMIDNLQEDLKNVDSFESLEGREKAKVFSQIVAFHQLLDSMQDEDFDDEEFEEEFELEEETSDEENHK